MHASHHRGRGEIQRLFYSLDDSIIAEVRYDADLLARTNARARLRLQFRKSERMLLPWKCCWSVRCQLDRQQRNQRDSTPSEEQPPRQKDTINLDLSSYIFRSNDRGPRPV